MIKALALLAVVAAASALPSYYLRAASCHEAENVTLCEVNLQVCKDLFTGDEDEHIRRDTYKSCLDQNGFNYLDVDPEILFSPTESEALSLFGTEEKHQAVRECVQREQGVLRPDGTADPQPFLERLTLALNSTRPDILTRLLYTAESCSIENIDDWKTCVLAGCGQGDLPAPVPTTLSPEEE
ncbi:uncharacterized protein LOC122257115 [Penaeus japonicus]|uniref:uncharacterized protein LOC122257115 n=1 Tax=Penaeus japonicus TaxID=27405 RepID=UPI001C714A4A|nr:uncharacterized protein LOC122257115 [Penaeus japonicus]